MRLQFAEGALDTMSYDDLRVRAWVDGSLGWSVADATVEFDPGPKELRSILLFHLERDDWKIVHQHWSFAASEDAYGSPIGSTLERLSKAAEAERPSLSEVASADGTTTLVFTDIEGSRALTAAFGDQAWIAVLRAHDAVIKDATEEHGGRVVKNRGDGFMLAFASARTAVACSQAIQRRIGETFNDPGSPIRVRIGIHTGEVTRDADDFFGHAVTYASRVADAAAGGKSWSRPWSTTLLGRLDSSTSTVVGKSR